MKPCGFIVGLVYMLWPQDAKDKYTKTDVRKIPKHKWKITIFTNRKYSNISDDNIKLNSNVLMDFYQHRQNE